MSERVIGKRVPLVEGHVKVTGSLKFGGDLTRPGMLHARLVTSPYPHARITRVDKTGALEVAGVKAVLTAEDLPEIPPRSRALLMLARERTLFVGHPVALVLASSEAAAQDGADQLNVDYEPLPAVLDLNEALKPDAQAVWPEGLPGASEEAAAHGASGGAGTSGAAAGSPNIANKVEFPRGDVEQGFRDADLVLERTFDTDNVHQGYIEPRVMMVEVEPGDQAATVWSSTQATFMVRDTVASILGLPNTSVRSIGTPVGGGFGAKFVLYEPLIALAAKQVGKPVRLFLSRYEEMVASTPAPATRARIKVGAKKDGTLCALEADFYMDNGCFPNSMGILAGVLLGSFYQAEHQVIRGYEVLTFKASSGAYRAPMAPQCAFALESMMDELATELDLDPIEIRLKNASKAGEPMAMGNPWPAMGMSQVLETLKEHPSWTNRDTARAAGRGVGIALGGWPGGTEPAAAACSLANDGTLQIHVGHADISGTNTSLAAIAAEAYGAELENVRVIGTDTATGPFAGATGGSKIIYTIGPAVIEAAQEARRQTLELAAHKLEAAVEDLVIEDGKVQVKGAPDSGIPLAKLAASTMHYGARQAPIYAHGRHAQQIQSPGFSAQLAEVEVDEETGAVTLHKLVVVQDVGRAINPMMVEGQMAGGAMQGVGWALYESMLWNEDGQVLTGSLTDYALPHATHLPGDLELVMIEVPSDSGPFGARGVGEPPVTATAAAIANAITNATGTRYDRLPMTPARLREACL